MAFPLILWIAGGAAALLALGGKKPVGQGWSPPAPGVSPGVVIELRAIEGVTYQCFVPSVADAILGMLGDSVLVPVEGSDDPTLAFYDVTPITPAVTTPGMTVARSIVLGAAEAGLCVMGLATLPYPAQTGRRIAIGPAESRKLAAGATRQPFAILCDKAQNSDPPYYEGSKVDWS